MPRLLTASTQQLAGSTRVPFTASVQEVKRLAVDTLLIISQPEYTGLPATCAECLRMRVINTPTSPWHAPLFGFASAR